MYLIGVVIDGNMAFEEEQANPAVAQQRLEALRARNPNAHYFCLQSVFQDTPWPPRTTGEIPPELPDD